MKPDGIISCKSMIPSSILIFSRNFIGIHRALIIFTVILKVSKTVLLKCGIFRGGIVYEMLYNILVQMSFK